MDVDAPTNEPIGHIPVLTGQVCELLDVKEGETVVDATVGLGGHAALLGERLGDQGTLIGLDADPVNLQRAAKRLAGLNCRVECAKANFSDLGDALGKVGVQQVDVILADLGISSVQLDDGDRGFSFQHDGPLDMRIDPGLKESAADLVNRLKDKELADVLYFNAQEMRSRRIAKRICMVRREGRIKTTGQLAEIVAKALHVNPDSRRSKIHPATRTFLALRMAVNNEMPALDALLESAPALLKPGGRIGVIAFHSVEDKRVKLDFRQRKTDGIYQIVTKKPIVADDQERRANPRSRSAKLRVAVRLADCE